MAQSVARLLNNISLLGRKRSAVRARVKSFFCPSGHLSFVGIVNTALIPLGVQGTHFLQSSDGRSCVDYVNSCRDYVTNQSVNNDSQDGYLKLAGLHKALGNLASNLLE